MIWRIVEKPIGLVRHVGLNKNSNGLTGGEKQ